MDDKCDYVEIEGASNLNPHNYNLAVLQLNIRSLIANQHELILLLNSLTKLNTRIDAVLLCETFLMKNTTNMVNIPGYTHVFNHQKNCKGGGVSILLKDGIPFKQRPDLEIFEEGEIESVFIETISKCGKTIIIGSMYRPPNTDVIKYSNSLSEIVTKTRTARNKLAPEIIIGMDHNVDLLKSNEHTATSNFIRTVTDLKLFPTITRPTRITHHSATLIDNIYVTEQLHRSFDSMLLLNDMSDHLPVLTLLKQTKILKPELLIFESRCLTQSKLKAVNHKLMKKDWIGLLNGPTCDEKFNQFSDTLNSTLDEIAPKNDQDLFKVKIFQTLDNQGTGESWARRAKTVQEESAICKYCRR